MNPRDAEALIATAVDPGPAHWADLGAGEGVFTRALAARLGSGGRVFAVDRDRRALGVLGRRAESGGAEVIAIVADFTRWPDTWDGLGDARLDGLLIANALHYVRDAGPTLARLVERLRSGGRVVLVEYDRRAANPWVPFPISVDRLPAVTRAAGLGDPRITARRPSAFGGDLYVAVAERL